MSEIAVEDETCADCGSEIRPEAVFCYNCGSSVDPENKSKSANGASDGWFRGNIADEESNEVAEADSIDPPLIKTADDGIVSTQTEPETEDMAVQRKAFPAATKTKNRIKAKGRMKSAASMRRKPKPRQQGKIKVVWEEKESSPGFWFITMSIVIIFFVAVLFALAVYLK